MQIQVRDVQMVCSTRENHIVSRWPNQNPMYHFICLFTIIFREIIIFVVGFLITVAVVDYNF